MRLKNKVAIITGSARGMGRVFALRFAQEGAKVTVCDVLDCAPVAEEIEAIGGEALALKVDYCIGPRRILAYLSYSRPHL
jgi:3-oxoacyl-[acyl-carrier protein] reductase